MPSEPEHRDTHYSDFCFSQAHAFFTHKKGHDVFKVCSYMSKNSHFNNPMT